MRYSLDWFWQQDYLYSLKKMYNDEHINYFTLHLLLFQKKTQKDEMMIKIDGYLQIRDMRAWLDTLSKQGQNKVARCTYQARAEQNLTRCTEKSRTEKSLVRCTDQARAEKSLVRSIEQARA